MGCIYKITNLINGKIYIGQTRFSIKKRYERHLYEAQRGVLQYPLYKAIRKYGNKNFNVEQIEEVSEDLLDERERYWIKYYDSFIKNNKGYNCTYGGEGNIVIDKLEVFDLWDQGDSIKQISDKTKHDRSAIRRILQSYPNYSIEESQKRGDKIQGKTRFKQVKQYDKEGNFIAIFDNMSDAQSKTGISSKNIWGVVNHKGHTAGGYQWRFSDDPDIPQNLLTKKKKKK